MWIYLGGFREINWEIVVVRVGGINGYIWDIRIIFIYGWRVMCGFFVIIKLLD